MITLELDVDQATSLRVLMDKEQERYTTDPSCVPDRISHIRQCIDLIDEQIKEQSVERLHEDIRKAESEATDYGVGK
jgi:hypothetical protein